MNIRRYTLIMGKTCNQNCKYCHQGHDKPPLNNQLPAAEQVVDYFPETGKYEIVLYGGEPLLYWDFLVEFCTLMKKKNPEVYFNMPTNGTLLTMDKVTKLNELNVGVVLSHDGRHHEKTRGYSDILLENPGPYLNLNRRHVAAVCCSLNPDFYDVWDYFEEFKHKHGLPVRETVFIQVCKDVEGNTPDELLIYNNQEFEKTLDRVFTNLQAYLAAGQFESYEYMQYEGMIKAIKNNIDSPDRMGIWCRIDKDVCDIDLHGNLYLCHNKRKPFGNISTTSNPVGNCSQYRNDPKCLACEAYIYCGGGCHVTIPEKRKFMCYTTYQQVIRMLKLLVNFK